jgi:hypothetical protein
MYKIGSPDPKAHSYSIMNETQRVLLPLTHMFHPSLPIQIPVRLIVIPEFIPMKLTPWLFVVHPLLPPTFQQLHNIRIIQQRPPNDDRIHLLLPDPFIRLFRPESGIAEHQRILQYRPEVRNGIPVYATLLATEHGVVDGPPAHDLDVGEAELVEFGAERAIGRFCA